MHGRLRVARALHRGKLHCSLRIRIRRPVRITDKWNLSLTHDMGTNTGGASGDQAEKIQTNLVKFKFKFKIVYFYSAKSTIHQQVIKVALHTTININK